MPYPNKKYKSYKSSKTLLIGTTQGRDNPYTQTRDPYRVVIKELKYFLNIIAQLDRGDLYDYWGFFQYILDNDLVIASICSSRKDRFVSKFWEVTPGVEAWEKPSEDDILAAKLVRFALSSLSNWYKIKRSIADAVILGYSTHEIEWGYADGLFLPRDIKYINPRRFVYTPDWELRLYDNGTRGGAYGEKLIEDKWIVHTSAERDGTPNYYGVIRTIGPVFIIRQWINQFFVHYLEKYGQPFPVAKVDNNTSAEVMNKILAALQQGSYDRAYVVKGNDTLELIKPSDTATVDGYEKYLARSEKDLTQYVLGTADINQAGVVGSLAAVETRTEAVADPKRDRDMMNLAATLQAQLFAPIIKFNHALFKSDPKIPHYREMYSNESDKPKTSETTSSAQQAQGTQPASRPPIRPQPTITASQTFRTVIRPESPFQINNKDAAASFEKTDTYKEKLFQALLDKLRADGVSEENINQARGELQRITLDALEKNKTADQVAREIINNDTLGKLGVTDAYEGYLTEAAQLNKDMALSGSTWDKVTDLAQETGETWYWQYHNMEDGQVRSTHKNPDLNGAVFTVGNPKTDKLLPPVDFGCRCFATYHKEVPEGATLYEDIPGEFLNVINPNFSW